MRIFIDFDDVIFNTKKFLVFLRDIFKEFGVTEELFRSAYQEMRSDVSGQNFCYNFEAHVEKISKHVKVDEAALIKALYEGLEQAPAFVFQDVKPFLEYLKKEGYTVDVLSFGDKNYQALKIKKAGLGALIANILVTQESKERILKNQNIEPLGDVWFFDDRVEFLENMKKSFPFMHTVLVSRPEGRFTDTKNSFCDYQIFDLKEATEIIKKSRQ